MENSEKVLVTQRVFAIPELLEQILLDLPMRTLLLSQRVNTTFHTVIKTSSKIQEALFFKALPNSHGEPDFNHTSTGLGGTYFRQAAVGFCGSTVPHEHKRSSADENSRFGALAGGGIPQETDAGDAADEDVTCCQTQTVLTAGTLYDLIAHKLIDKSIGGLDETALNVRWCMFWGQKDINQHVELEDIPGGTQIETQAASGWSRYRAAANLVPRNALLIGFQEFVSCLLNEVDLSPGLGPSPRAVMLTEDIGPLTEFGEIFGINWESIHTAPGAAKLAFGAGFI
ncbi:hypothetical protein ABW19_dt0210186 [Dactylella cylindrospora]|nr:hypothetical protein ABW19_dt0210186 [Dactylella cylindrospora]